VHYGDIVQIDPQKDKTYGSCYIFVEKVKNWGIEGYVQIPERGKTHLRKRWDEIEWVGQSVWSNGNK